MPDVLDLPRGPWCNLCQSSHEPCVDSDHGGDGFVLFEDEDGVLWHGDERWPADPPARPEFNFDASHWAPAVSPEDGPSDAVKDGE